MSRIQLSMTAFLVSLVYLSQVSNIDKLCIGVTQLEFAMSSVMPLGVGHGSLGCSPSGPGTSGDSGGSIAPGGSRSSSVSVSEDEVSRFFLLKTTLSTGGTRAHDGKNLMTVIVIVKLLQNMPEVSTFIKPNINSLYGIKLHCRMVPLR